MKAPAETGFDAPIAPIAPIGRGSLALPDESRAPLDSVISTAELNRHRARPPDHAAENRALTSLSSRWPAPPDASCRNSPRVR